MARPKAKRIGDLQLVENTQRRFGAAMVYFFARVQYPDGTEVPVLFTADQLRKAENRADRNREDLLEVGSIRNLLD